MTATTVLAVVTEMAVGATGAAVPADAVVILAGTADRLVAVNVNGPPKELVVIFCMATVGRFAALVKVQVNLAKAFRFATGMVSTLPAREPKAVAGLPEVPELVSRHEAVESVKLLLAPSVIVTCVTVLVTVIGAGATGAAVPAVTVVMLLIVPVRLVAVKVKGPLAAPVVIFWMATVGMAGLTMLVNVQVICAFARMLVAGTVNTLPASVPKVVPGLPEAAEFESRHEAEFMEKLAASVSVMVTAVPTVVADIGAIGAG